MTNSRSKNIMNREYRLSIETISTNDFFKRFNVDTRKYSSRRSKIKNYLTKYKTKKTSIFNKNRYIKQKKFSNVTKNVYDNFHNYQTQNRKKKTIKYS